MIDENTEHLYVSGSDSIVTMFKIDGKTLQQLKQVKIEA